MPAAIQAAVAMRVPARVKAAIDRQFNGLDSGSLSRAQWLASRFLAQPDYEPEFFQAVLRVARGESGDGWRLRCFAAAMLERQLATLRQEQLPQFEIALSSLGLKQPDTGLIAPRLAGGPPVPITFAEFVPQLLRRINRRAHVHPRQGRHSKKGLPGELLDLLHRSTQECKLSLAPCVFSPEEVLQRIMTQVAISEGVPLSGFPGVAAWSSTSDGPFHFRPFECGIVKELARAGQVYWVSGATSSRINSMVEYPLGTVALVLKLPGSDLEIELKRAGKRERPLGVLYQRQGSAVPVAHRLQGGSTGWMLQAEADNESRFRTVFRRVHDHDPPFSRTLLITNVRRIPTPNGNANLLSWFMDPLVFGAGYQEMRSAMKSCVEAGGSEVPAQPLGLTVAFLRDAKPRQSILAGTSSFRLDRLREYLSERGPQTYFREGLGVAWKRDDARRFADDLLEETLGTYVPPNVAYHGHQQYLRAALEVGANRAAANAHYGFCMDQIGLVWGTMLALGAYSIGESFVPRNVGLKSVWKNNAWRVQIVFMDHDCLNCPGPEQDHFDPGEAIAGAIHDETHIFGHALRHRANIGAVTCLQEIYAVPKAIARNARLRLRTAMQRSFRQTRALTAKHGLLSAKFLGQLLDFEEVVRRSLRPGLQGSWKKPAKRWLAAKGYADESCRQYLDVTEEHQRFFRAYAFLYEQASVATSAGKTK